MKSSKLIKYQIILLLIFILLPLGITLLLGCDGMVPAESIKDPNLSKEGVFIDRDSLFATHENNTIKLEFNVYNNTDTEKETHLNFDIQNVYNKDYIYGSKKEKLQLEKGINSYQLKIPTSLKEKNYKGSKTSYVWFNIKYSIHYDKKTKKDVKSLYTAMNKYNLQVVASNQWEAESKTPVRVKITRAGADKVVKNQKIKLKLMKQDGKNIKTIIEKEIRTDNEGEALLNIDTPKDKGSYTLAISSRSIDTDFEEQAEFYINVNKDKKIYITTDKPMYQPGQDVHIRALALDSMKKPIADKDALITIYDGKGNKVFKNETKTNEFGVTSAIFKLASFVNLGHYKIEIEMEDSLVEKTISVERYVLPKFKVSVDTDKDYYSLGEEVKGTVSANYFFGKPVSNSEVMINLYTFDVEWNQVTSLTGYTDKNGDYSFNMEVPSYLVGSQLEQGSAFVRLEVIVTDNAKHTQGTDKTIAISESPIVPVIFPETDKFGKNMNIKFYVVTADPLGRPMKTSNTIFVGGEKIKVDTNEQGVGSFMFDIDRLPINMKITSKTKQYTAEDDFYFTGGATYQSEHILLRTDKPNYTEGDTINATIYSTFGTKRVYLDIIKEKRTLLTKTIELKNKLAKLRLPIDRDMGGVIKVSAYAILSDSSVVRDTRLVYVDLADEVKVNITPEREEYLPGEDAKLNVSVTDDRGKGAQSAVGFVIVDEAVYALQENKPGLEKVYFEIEEAMKEPKYEIHSFSFQNIFITDDTIDPEKAEAFLTATTPEIDTGIQYSSAYNEIGMAKSNIQYMINENVFYKVAEKLNDYLYRNHRLRDKKTPLKEQVKKIIEENKVIVYDFWEKQVKIALEEKTMSFISAGFDQTFGTKDDFVFSFDLSELQYIMWDLIPVKEELFLENEANMNDGGAWTEETNSVAIGDSYEEDKARDGGDAGEEEGDSGVRVRKYFPETLYVEPSLITDKRGRGEVSLTVADSITTWRISSTANTKDGKLGSNVSSLRVFQEFFIDIDFPVSLTQNDEVSVPIAIYNYLKEDQTITLTVKERDWFELLDEPVKKRTLEPNEVTVEYFRIRVKEIGNHAFQVLAKGSSRSDAIERRIEIKPDGDPIELSYSDRLDNNVKQIVTLPGDAIDKSQQVIVKIYPGLFSQVVEGLDSLFRMPGGCFEQTSSTTYPNVLALKYMQDTGIISPEIEMKASNFINQGYQRLLTFEVPGGGFEWFGNPPAHNILTAYGLMEFYDMSLVHNVDPAVITRTQNFLVSRQKADGSFPPDEGGIPEGAINAYQGNVLRTTGYLAWALAYSGYDGEPLHRALNFIRSHLKLDSDSYTLGILANAFLIKDSKDETGQQILSELDNRKKSGEKGYYWEQELQTSMYGSDNVAQIETTALICYAMIIGKSHFGTVEGAINYLITKKDSFGNWHSTQSTVATLRTFIKSLEAGSSESEGTINIYASDKHVKKINITKKNYDVMQQIDISPFINKGDNKIELKMTADEGASFLYQIAGTYYIPHEEKIKDDFQPLTIAMSYDKTTLKVDDMIEVDVSVSNNYPDVDLGMMIIDLGIAPGFDIVMDDFADYLENGMFSRVEPAGRQLILYIDEMKANENINFNYRMKARFPMKVKSPASAFYSYYGDEKSTYQPKEIEVSE